ncbi:MAG: flotillin domain-containing protein [Mesorhizobium sp.]
MTLLVSLIVVVVAIVIGVAFLQRYYRKATREKALLRTGLGGQKVVMDGGFIALPFLHRVEEIPMRTMRVEIKRAGEKSLMTEDRLRVDVEMAFYLRVEPTIDGVATAAQALGARALRPDEIGNLFEGRFIDAVQAIVAAYTMETLHERRGAFVKAVRDALAENLKQNGLHLESVSLIRLDQAAFAALDQNNAFNAVGMRRLAEIITENRKRRAEIEAEADLAVRQTDLTAVKRRLDIEREQQEAEIAQRLTLDRLRADTDSQTETVRQGAQRAAEQARIERTRDLRLAEIDSDLQLRQSEVEALLAAETAKIDSEITLARKRIEEVSVQAEAERGRVAVVEAQEGLQAERDRLVAEREGSAALIRARHATEASGERARGDAASLVEKARGEAEAAELRAAGRRHESAAETEARRALFAAENQQSEALMRMKLDMHKMDRLPDLAERMAKPLEKIDSIRINHVSGLGLGGRGPDGAGGLQSQIGGAVDGILSLALQLPAMQKLGQSIGLNLDLDQGNGAPVEGSTPPRRQKSNKGDQAS